jgi:hypothetical protein
VIGTTAAAGAVNTKTGETEIGTETGSGTVKKTGPGTETGTDIGPAETAAGAEAGVESVTAANMIGKPMPAARSASVCVPPWGLPDIISFAMTAVSLLAVVIEHGNREVL